VLPHTTPTLARVKLNAPAVKRRLHFPRQLARLLYGGKISLDVSRRPMQRRHRINCRSEPPAVSGHGIRESSQRGKPLQLVLSPHTTNKQSR